VRSSQVRIVTRLSAGFAAVLLLTVIMAGLAVRTMTIMSDMAADLYAHPFAVTNAVKQVESQLNAMRADVLTMIQHRDPEDVVRLSAQIAIKDSEMTASLAVIHSQYLGDAEEARLLSEKLAQWRAIRDQNIRYCQIGDFDAAAANARQHGTPQVAVLRRELAGIYAFASDKAAEFNRHIGERHDEALREIGLTLGGLLIFGILLAQAITRSIVMPLGQLRETMHRLAEGDLAIAVPDHSRVTEVARMATAVEVFKQSALRLESQRWITDTVARLSLTLQQVDTLADFAATALDVLVPLSGAGVAVFYARPSGRGLFVRQAGWGLSPSDEQIPESFAQGEGIVGEAARTGTPIVLDSPPTTWLRIASATGTAPPSTILTVPVMSRGTALAVLEFAGFTPFGDDQRAVIEAALPVLALNLEILERNLRTMELLEETQTQAEELKASEEELRSQSEALQAVNEELRLKTDALEERGRALEEARAEADRRTLEVEQASRYKSEFLSNMSHELRTPLNSVLILARDLADNEPGNLSDEQMESARVIHDSGTHLLALINDVLDLSKVEAGKMTLSPTAIPLPEFVQGVSARFAPVAADKGLDFRVETAPGLPPSLVADRGKIDQIVNNLVSNAIKFTATGGITLRMAVNESSTLLTLSVADTGIGIAEQDRQRVFTAFEQVDSGTSRQFGGTGLGLTISRRLARLMGGDITLGGNGDRGCIFTLTLPLGGAEPAAAPCASEPPTAPSAAPSAESSRSDLPKGRLLLVIEDDPVFRRIVCDQAHQMGFATVTAGDGKTGLDLARLRHPCGIVLDIGLPGMSGWEVIEMLKRSPETHDIPVHVISAKDEAGRTAHPGTVGHLTKPVSRDQISEVFQVLLRAGLEDARRSLLLVDGDPASCTGIAETLSSLNLDITVAETAAQALERLAARSFDCMILDVALPDMPGGEFLAQASRMGTGLPPVIAYSRNELSQDQTLRIREFTDSIVIKGTRSAERLLDEVGLFLHAIEAKGRNGGKGTRKTKPAAAAAEPADAALAGRTVLLVDDDMRSAFALSKVLRAKGLKVLIAQDGAKALSQLQTRDHVDVVLMDIMMPGMDGYQTIGEIRKDPRFTRLPIIALTAKAMPGDRDRCLAAGADDYLTKPVDMDALRRIMAAQIQRGHSAQPA